MDLTPMAHLVLLCAGPEARDMRPPGSRLCPRGQWPEGWRILALVQPGQLHSQVWPRNLLCRLPAQLERKSLLVSTPRLATAFLRGVRSAGPAATSQRRTLRIQQGRRGRDPLDPPHLLAP